MEDRKDHNPPDWAQRHSIEGEALERLRNNNSRWRDVHIDRFRYSHTATIDGVGLSFSCGTKYDPNDTSGCMICRGYKLGRTMKECYRAQSDICGYPRSREPYEIIASWTKKDSPKSDKIIALRITQNGTLGMVKIADVQREVEDEETEYGHLLENHTSDDLMIVVRGRGGYDPKYRQFEVQNLGIRTLLALTSTGQGWWENILFFRVKDEHAVSFRPDDPMITSAKFLFVKPELVKFAESYV